MLSERTVSIASGFWAAYLGCPAHELFAGPFRIVTHGRELADYGGAFALFRGGATIASVPPDRADALRALLAGQAQGSSPGSFACALGSVSAAVVGPAFIGYAAAVSQPVHPARAIGPGDAAAFQALQKSCDATEWDHGGSSIERPSSGVFVGGRLVAMAGYDVWGGAIAHLSIFTHADFRSRGFGRSAVAHLAERAIAAGLLPQYRTLESNGASIRVAEALGFRHYAASLAVRLHCNAQAKGGPGGPKERLANFTKLV
jgi:GNAT superfamily N-acetyltransferase